DYKSIKSHLLEDDHLSTFSGGGLMRQTRISSASDEKDEWGYMKATDIGDKLSDLANSTLAND
ncbi:MAG TPA: hypothetical protein VJ944_00270, partial [Thermoplasmataceae archaeon]|nr:hypothetical protein [Thermoplasmataceae archaeon]